MLVYLVYLFFLKLCHHISSWCHLLSSWTSLLLDEFRKLTAQLPLKTRPKKDTQKHRPVGENEWILVMACLDKIANCPKVYQYSLLVFQLLSLYRFCTGKPRSVVGQSLPLFHSSAQWPLSPLRFRFLPAKPSLGRFWVGKDMENLPIFGIFGISHVWCECEWLEIFRRRVQKWKTPTSCFPGARLAHVHWHVPSYEKIQWPELEVWKKMRKVLLGDCFLGEWMSDHLFFSLVFTTLISGKFWRDSPYENYFWSVLIHPNVLAGWIHMTKNFWNEFVCLWFQT